MENRECPLCVQIIPPGDDCITISQIPEKRILHIGCAENIKKALEGFRYDQAYTEDGHEE